MPPVEIDSSTPARHWSAAEVAAGLADTRQRLARLVRLLGATVRGDDRTSFVQVSAAELLENAYLRPRTAAKMVLRWNGRHCRPPLGRAVVLALFERAAVEDSR